MAVCQEFNLTYGGESKYGFCKASCIIIASKEVVSVPAIHADHKKQGPVCG